MGKQVLIVDDEPNIVTSLKFILERDGFAVQTRDNGKDALELIGKIHPNLLILDVMLPDMDGFEILRQLRSDQSTQSLPVLMLTAKGQREDRNNAIKFGADLFITKPFANEDVISAVRQLASTSE